MRAAATSAPHVPYRSRGAFAMPRASTASTAGGSAGRFSLAAGGGSCTCAHRSAISESRRNGGSPVRHSKSTHDSA